LPQDFFSLHKICFLGTRFFFLAVRKMFLPQEKKSFALYQEEFISY